jgi:hypothetical protein
VSFSRPGSRNRSSVRGSVGRPFPTGIPLLRNPRYGVAFDRDGLKIDHRCHVMLALFPPCANSATLRALREHRAAPPPIGGSRALRMLNDHVVSFCSWPSSWYFRGQNVSPRMQRTLQRQTTLQVEKPQRRALLDRRNGPKEMKILR